MRGIYFSWFVAAAVALCPLTAWGGNQEVAEQIAASLKNSGQFHAYKIGVRYEDGTAWLRGTVADEQQSRMAVQMAYQTPGVRRVINDLTVRHSEAVTPTAHQETAAAEQSGRSLQQAQGAFAPERVSHANSAGLVAGIPAQKVSEGESSSLFARIRDTVTKPLGGKKAEPQRADPVPATFDPMPVRPTAGEEPTLAAPQLGDLAMAETPQPRTSQAPRPMPIAYSQEGASQGGAEQAQPTPAPMAQGQPLGRPMPQYVARVGGPAPARYDQPQMPNHAWPSYAAYPNYAGVTYPKQYSPTAWPYIGPFYPYPQVPLGWRKVTLEWHDGWWFLDFDDGSSKGPFSGLFRPLRHR